MHHERCPDCYADGQADERERVERKVLDRMVCSEDDDEVIVLQEVLRDLHDAA